MDLSTALTRETQIKKSFVQLQAYQALTDFPSGLQIFVSVGPVPSIWLVALAYDGMGH